MSTSTPAPLKTIILILAALVSPVVAAPIIICICTVDHAGRAGSAYARSRTTAPHVDRIEKEGRRFDRGTSCAIRSMCGVVIRDGS